jgi:hypothetical protein
MREERKIEIERTEMRKETKVETEIGTRNIEIKKTDIKTKKKDTETKIRKRDTGKEKKREKEGGR